MLWRDDDMITQEGIEPKRVDFIVGFLLMIHRDNLLQ